MIFKYHIGERVALRHDSIVLKAGDEGIVWAIYDIEPPAYEVTFTDSTGEEFDALMYEEELEPLYQDTDSAQSSTTADLGVAPDDPPTI